MRVIFFAVPLNEKQQPKKIADSESEEACWVTLEDLTQLSKKMPGLRGPELYEWGTYIEKGGLIAPLTFMSREDDPLSTTNMEPLNQVEELKSVEEVKINVAPTKSAEKVGKAIINVESNDDISLRKLLLEGLNPDSEVNNKNWTMLHLAIKYNHLNIVTMLLLAGANIGAFTHNKRNAIHFAAQSTLEVLTAVLLRLNTMTGIKKQELVNFQDVNGESPLHFASKIYGTTAIYRLLVDNGADVNMKNSNGKVAAENGNVESSENALKSK